MTKILIIITIVINFSICGFAQERYIKSEVLDSIRKDLDTKNYNSFDSTKNLFTDYFKKGITFSLKSGFFISDKFIEKLKGTGISAGIIYNFNKNFSISSDFDYYFKTQAKPYSDYHISLNTRFYTDRDFSGLFVNTGISYLFHNESHLESKNYVADRYFALNLGLGLYFDIYDKFSFEILSKCYFVPYPIGFYIMKTYFALNLGINYNL